MSSQYINEPATSGKVCLHTSAGDIEVELWTRECPLACRNFIQLCMEGYYNGTIFHRLVKDFILQGGDPSGTGQGGDSIYGKPFKDEFHQRLRFSRRGLLGMANAGKDDNASQFFFTIGTEPPRDLDRLHTLFGKIEGPTIFNMLKMTECDADANDRPLTIHKITGATILANPFDDIKPREKEKRKKEHKKEKKVETKKLNLLSFGDEAEEDEQEFVAVNKRLASKGKSAHDVLDDVKLSKQVAVTKDELGDYEPEEDDHDPDEADRIRAKFAKKRKLNEEKDDDKDEDLETMIDEEKKRRQDEKLAAMSSELKTLQKSYKKALRKPKETEEVEEEEEVSEVMMEYKQMKMKFKSKTKKLLSKRDKNREQQTMDLLERFQAKLEAVDQQAILFDKKIGADLPSRPDLSGETEEKEKDEKKFGVDLDAEDDAGADWMNHKFVAEDEDPNVTKAKDANLRETDEDWYDLTDPRNKINQRKRGEI